MTFSDNDESIEQPDEGGETPFDQTVDLSGRELGSGSSSGDEATMDGSTTPSEAPQATEAIGSWIGPYKLLQKIGAGGMGAVYMAEQREPVSRRVALKIIKAGMDSDQVIARFEAERQALSMMEHPNIARVLDAGTTEVGRPYFVMELVHGQPITTFCDKYRLSIEERLLLFTDVCNAIQHAHQKGIIHRDLKPSNILVAKHDDRPVPKVIDFGVAKATNQRLTEKTMFTQYGEVVGTLEYMSPEQAQMTDINVDTRSDIYSLGVLLYELLTGSTPLKKNKVREAGYLEVLTRIQNEEAPKPSSRLTETVDKLERIADARNVESRRLPGILRGDLDWIVLKALEKDRGRRYETTVGLATDIHRYLNAEPITARPPTGFYLLRKFARRHRAAVFTGVAVLITLIGGITAATWQAVRAKRAEKTVAAQLVELQKNIALEKQNETLQQKVQRENQAQRTTRLAQIRSVIERGQWIEGLSRIAEYRGSFGEPPIDVLILQLNAFDGLSQYEQLKNEIVRLEKHPEAERFQPQLQLWRGYGFLSAENTDTDGKALIEAAIRGGLDDDDRLFAEGLVADSLTDAAEMYQKSLSLSPFHSRARIQLIITLILLGRYEEVQDQVKIAKSLFANDKRFYFADTISHALANRTGQARNALNELKGKFPAARVRDMYSLIGLSQSVNNQFKEYDRSGLFDWFSILPNGIPLFQGKGMQAIPIPEFQKVRVFNAYGEYANSFLNPLLPLMSERNKHRSMVETCRKAYRIHPDGVFKCFEGWSWYALKDYKNSYAAFALAIDSDGLFPDIKNQALYGAFASRMAAHRRNREPQAMREAMGYLERYIATSFESHRADVMFRAACRSDRWDLAREIVSQMVDRGESRRVWYDLLIELATQRENYGLALSACDELLIEYPLDGRLLARRQNLVDLICNQRN